jgi:hypothetical protein
VSNGEKRAIKQTIEYCAAFSGAGKEKGAFPMEKLHAMIEE